MEEHLRRSLSRHRPRIILAVLAAALSFGVFTSTSRAIPIQQFDTSGAYEVDVLICYGGSAPVPDGGDAGRAADCGPGSSSTSVVRDTILPSWTIVSQPIGTRPGLPITYTPSDGTTEWQAANTVCSGPDANNECSSPVGSGSVTGRTDVLCTNGTDDVLGDAGGTGGAPETEWPDMTGSRWPLPVLRRTSASAANGGYGVPTGGPNAYVQGVSPWPTTGVNAFAFATIETAILTQFYLSGTAPFPLPVPVRMQLSSATSAYASQAGLSVSAVLQGDSPDNPPDDSFICFDSPQDSVMTSTMRTPDADRVIPRWATITSAPDLRDGKQQVLLDWACITVGTGEPDADGDCDPDATDSNSANKDIDGDLVPDGVERALGSSPTAADTDVDGSNDFREMTLFTDPTVTDSDADGQADKLDTSPTGCARELCPVNIDVTETTDDNCPAVANGATDGDPGRPGIQASQINTDSIRQYHGMGVGTGDASNPDEDIPGDACDADDDNDGLPDGTEGVFTIVPWSGGTDPGGTDFPDTTVCAGPGVGVAPIDQQLADGSGPSGKTWGIDGSYIGDMDLDLVLDGRECEFRSRPDVSRRAIASCNNVMVDADGCAQPNNGAGGGPVIDDDNDGLFLPFSNSHVRVEAAYRTMHINVGPGVVNNDIDNDGIPGDVDKDSDADLCANSACDGAVITSVMGLQDGSEVLFYNTGPATNDTDGDSCMDGEEIFDSSGDFKITAGDQLSWVRRLRCQTPASSIQMAMATSTTTTA